MSCHRDTMQALARAAGWKRGVEVGLGHGNLFRRFVALGIDMVGVDLGRRIERKRAVEAIGGGRVYWMPSTDAAALVADGWADFVFIDAGHSYEAVKADIAAWEPKVRPGGWLGGHDHHPRFPGVIRAVGERFGDRLTLLPGNIWARAGC
jgi:SAM-dependent methyltransferase